ncbi:hypothetical protein BDD14_5522 [Edaphobacter modestus]|uniref:Uncharacterized protein n=1 Tax=Edaphobacter modestus TaxID=388466 RepID=A0A4Q7YG67_9BACT|nr:hypothetical protein BDD14_5522 [Edaphobacter modestus]
MYFYYLRSSKAVRPSVVTCSDCIPPTAIRSAEAQLIALVVIKLEAPSDYTKAALPDRS